MGLKKSKQQKISSENNNINIQNSNDFENLSNELIYELFDYLSFHDISLAFGNINSRFQNLIDTYSHYVNLQQYNNNNHLLPRYIHSLKINACYQLNLIDLSTIVSLRGLSISNLSTFRLLHIFNTISLKELEYVYLGACLNNEEDEEKIFREIQEKIFSLGEFKLQKCIFRMQLFANIDKLPNRLLSLEYLRIDGCQNILIVNELLDRMPNLRSFYVSILESVQVYEHHLKRNNKHKCLTNLKIRIHHTISLEQLMPLLDQNGSQLKKLTIYFDSFKQNTSVHNEPDNRFENLHQRVTTIINQSLPQLIKFQLCQYISQNYDYLLRTCYVPPYVEEIPSSLQHKAYRVSIAADLATLWQNNGCAIKNEGISIL